MAAPRIRYEPISAVVRRRRARAERAPENVRRSDGSGRSAMSALLPRTGLVVVCLLACACGGHSATRTHPDAPGLTPALARTLQALLNEKVGESGVAGASAAIVFPDGREWTGATGYADSATKRAMT